MDIKKAESILIQIAKQEGVSIETVRGDIEAAITEARDNPDPKVKAFWKSIPCKGDYPTPEEAITYMAGITGKNKRSKDL